MKFWTVHFHDGDFFAFKGEKAVRRCSSCGQILDKWDLSHEDLTLDRVRGEVSASYDGLMVVGERFRCEYESSGWEGLEFRSTGSPEWSWIRSPRRVCVDTVRRKTRLLEKCESCGIFGQVAGATPPFVKESVESNSFVWTDVEFGSGDEKHPLLLCGDAIGESLRRSKFKGLDIESYSAS